MRLALLSIAILLLQLPLPAHAQVTAADALTLSISPENPHPYETVTVTPSSSLLDLTAARITITVNGKVIESGNGAQRVPVTVGGPGELTTISVSASVGGATYTSRVSFRPGDVALIVEPTSTTHPLYLGAPLVASQSRVRVIALADLRTSPATRLNPANLVYTWYWGDQLLADQSGVGHSILTATAPVRYRDAQISVTVTNTDQSIVASAATTISPVDPIVRIYPTDPLSGPDFEHALAGTYTMSGEEQAFRGVAYYFGATPSLAWSVSGTPASADQQVTVRTTGSGAGTAPLSLSALLSAPQQSAIARLSVSFGNERSSNIFGF